MISHLKHYFGYTIVLLTPTIVILWLSIKLTTFHSQQAYKYFNELLFAFFMRTFLFLFGYMNIKKVYIYGDIDFVKKKGEKAVYISNHLSTADWFICSILISHQGGLGRTRFVLHKNLKYIPIFGFYLSQDSCLFVDRQNFDAKSAVNVLNDIKRLQSNTWMVIYPEGTRYNPWKRDVIKQSQKFAAEKAGIKPFKHVLVPRRRGLQLILNQMHDCLDVLYDVTTVFADENGYPYDHSIPAPGLTDWLLKPRSLYIYLKRIPIKQIPTESHSICQWLYGRYRIKDDFIDNVQARFYKPLHNQDNQCINDNTIDYESNTDCNYVPRLSKDLPTIKQNFLDCFTSEMTKQCLELEQFHLLDVLPYAVLFYGITIYWIVGFGWYGLLSYLAVGLFGTIGGHLYMHFVI
ncbi:hypothetical protein MN116_000879 [Schistosoma mekongi]|uniref:Phospholipid/glycerol acyltransferase domain-containing protein n=1 Tax=Schistosoma mekongi TaxID=38744 RepID=A0AAE1ZLK1_SCHME|nr:hypothetical protein MN116_000879 [Schistosoma mekongi]